MTKVAPFPTKFRGKLRDNVNHVPILTEDDMITDDYSRIENGKLKHCLEGWCQVTFEGWFGIDIDKLFIESASALGFIDKEKIKTAVGTVNLNDNYLKTNEQRADTWNLGMARIGFLERNPMADMVEPRSTEDAESKESKPV